MIVFLPAVLSLLLGTLAVGALAKLLVHLSRRYALTWRDAFQYGFLVMVLSFAVLLLRYYTALAVPALVALLVAPLFHIALGGWFLGQRVKESDGSAVRFRRGAAFGLLVFALMFILGLAAGALQGLAPAPGGALGI